MKMKNLVFVGVLLLSVFSCRTIPAEVDEVLSLASVNKGELKKVLRHYGWCEQDSLKFRAACFLIGNMRWHFSYKKVTGIDPLLEEYCWRVDSAFYAIWQEKQGKRDSLVKCGRELRQRYKWLGDSIRKFPFRKPEVEQQILPDLFTLGSKFLIGHIDNAFRQWQTSPFAKRLSFDEFCESILPYRPARGYTFLYSGDQLNVWFAKYVNYDTTAGLVPRIVRYNRRVQEVRNFLKKRPMEDIGIYGLFFHGHECLDIAAYGCAVLRACGIPVRIEFCDAYRDFAGRHFYCITADTNGVWQTFNPESSIPGTGKWVSGEAMNLYRQCYGAQKDSPYFLKNTGEYLPPLFSTPCIQEVTAERMKVFGVTLPFRAETANRVAYLAAFQNQRELSPVTWGKIDSSRQEVDFANVIPGRLYFPVYYREQEVCSFGDPFYVVADSLERQGYRIHCFHTDTLNKRRVVITRKFPQKPNMKKVAERLTGATFCGANRADFSDARLLYTITTPPGPWLQDFVFPAPGLYRYYRFKAPDKHPHANVAWLEFLTNVKYGYSNVLPSTPAAVLHPEDTVREAGNTHWMKLLDAPSWDKMKWKAEYDGNMQTAPSAYPTVFLRLEKPQVVERIRFAPKNADNGICRGDEYELFFWNNGWESCGRQVARFEYLEFQNVPEGTLLWLRNYSSGKEELPFVFQNGRQLFLYYDMM